jgi:aspartate/methionine/tyrosine aminotransferase
LNPYLANLNEFTFTRLARLLAGVATPSGVKPINLSIGEPKHPTPQFIRDAIAANTAGLAQYPPSKGSPELRNAIANWIKRRFDLKELSAETQVLPVVGTKEAIYSLTQLVIDPTKSNPTVLVPNPFYMVYEGAATLCGAKPYYVNFDAKTGHYDWDSVPEAVWKDTQLLIACSPDNPTGRIIPQARWKWLFEQSDRYGFVILADECYSEIYFDEAAPPHGALQVAQALGRNDYKRLIAMGSPSRATQTSWRSFCICDRSTARRCRQPLLRRASLRGTTKRTSSPIAPRTQRSFVNSHHSLQNTWRCRCPMLRFIGGCRFLQAGEATTKPSPNRSTLQRASPSFPEAICRASRPTA